MPLAFARAASLFGLLLIVCPSQAADVQSPKTKNRATVQKSTRSPAAPAVRAQWAPPGVPNAALAGTPQAGMNVGTPYYWGGSSAGAAYSPYGAAYSPYGAGGYAPGAYSDAGFYGPMLPAGDGYGGSSLTGGYGIPGGYSAGGGDPYMVHFGPGYYRQGDYGHFRFPFYSYRRPWYFPGQPSYNRDTNFPW